MVDPISIIGLIIDVVPKVTKYLIEVKKGPTERRLLLAEVLSTSGILALIRDVGRDSNDDQSWAYDVLHLEGMEIVLQELLELLQTLAKKLEPKTGFSAAKQTITWPFSQTDIENFLNKIGRCKQNIMLAFQIQERGDTWLILKQLDKLAVEQQQISVFTESQALQDRRRNQESALTWLSTFDYQKKHVVTSTTRLDGTAVWIFNDTQFKNWHTGSTDILFCIAGPGHGKTIIASSIIDYLREEQEYDDTVAVAYIYLDYKERVDQNLPSILALLLKQIIRNRPKALNRLHQLYVEKAAADVKLPDILDVISLLEDTANEYRKMYLVIDAFDESESTRAQEDLAEHLVSLQELDCQTKILITSRAKPSTAGDFHNADTLELQVCRDDIRSYLEYRMRSERKLRRQVDKDADLRAKIVNVIIKKCDGMFLLARLHMDTLSGARTRADLEDSLASLPSGKDGLIQTYFEAIERIRSQDKRDVVLAERILAWLCYCARPLKVNELRYALTVNVDRTEKDLNENRLLPEEDILSLCGGLVLIDTNTSELRLVHHTTQEYFSTERQKLFPTAQKEIALACVKFLQYERFGRRCSNKDEIDRLIQDNPFLKYAEENLGRHSLEAGGAGTDEIVKLFTSVSHLNCLNQVKHSICHENPGVLLVSSVTTAVLYRLPDVVKKLVTMTKNINLRRWSNRPAIVEAVYHGDQEIVETLLAAKPDLQIWDRHRNTVLHAAACRGHLSLISTLIDLCRENLNARNANGNTPLHDAIGFGHAKAVPILLNAGADLCISNNAGEGQSPLFMASLRGRTAIVKTVLDAYIAQDKLRFQDKSGITPLHIAAVYGLETRVENIVNQCPDVIDRTNHLGKSALHDAVERNWIGVVHILIQHGATIDLRDNEGRTALSWAAHKDNIEIAKFLLDNGADPSVPTWEKSLAHLAGSTSSPELARALFAHPKFDYTLRGQWGISGFQQAVYYHHNETASLFLEHDRQNGYASLNAVGSHNWGNSAMHDAAGEGNLEMARKMLETGKCELGIRNKEGWTALEVAKSKGHQEVVDLLIRYGSGE